MKLQSDVAISIPKDHQVLIKVQACSVNPMDTQIHSGTYSRKPLPPYTPGLDVAEITEAIGESVSAFKKGDRVFTTSMIDPSTWKHETRGREVASNTYSKVFL